MANEPKTSNVITKYKKMIISLRYWLLGRGYTKAVDAMELAFKYHVGLRKDGITPGFQHQLEIAHYIRTLPIPEEHMEACIIVALLHDLPEDYDYSLENIRDQFGSTIRDATWLVTKKYQGMKKEAKDYYEQIATNLIASIVKGVDRIHNIQSMQGVFSEEKQKSYIDEVHTYIYEMLKTTRRDFPALEPAFENIKFVLTGQIQLINHIHGWA